MCKGALWSALHSVRHILSNSNFPSLNDFGMKRILILLTIIYILIYTNSIRKELIIMMTAKVFENGRSQAVRLPKECRFNTDEVAVNRIGDIVLLMPKTNKWSSFMQAIDMFSDDFMQDGREGSLEQEREAL